ncbi:Aspartic peptidase [Gossypium australe]|uniref:Aspartic peptidase n=1 Tax=Gossypium australe TaxID=47621 RepID=A0A5B6WZB6_9ROSI|nr:Aspartic peptidase [Gossypium australe]
MLVKFILVYETRFQNTEASLRNHQLARLVLEKLQDNLPSNTETNPKEQVSAVTLRSEKVLIDPEKNMKQEVVEKYDGVKDRIKEKNPLLREYKPPIPYLAKLKKHRIDENFYKFLKLFKQLHINLPFVEALS